MTQATPPTLTGQDVAEAQGALRGLIDETLAGADVTSIDYIVLRVLAGRGPYEDRAALQAFLVGQRQLNLSVPAAAALLDRLAANGLVAGVGNDDAGPVRLTVEGEELLGRLTNAIAPVTARLYADFDPDELATAHRVLVDVVRRATRLSDDLRRARGAA